MVDKEKLIRGLHCCAHTDGINCMHCPYDKKGEDCTAQMSMDVLTLLKEQEAVEPKTGHWIYKKYDDMFMCSCCEKYSIRNDYPYCHWCGAKMEGR